MCAHSARKSWTSFIFTQHLGNSHIIISKLNFITKSLGGDLLSVRCLVQEQLFLNISMDSQFCFLFPMYYKSIIQCQSCASCFKCYCSHYKRQYKHTKLCAFRFHKTFLQPILFGSMQYPYKIQPKFKCVFSEWIMLDFYKSYTYTIMSMGVNIQTHRTCTFSFRLCINHQVIILGLFIYSAIMIKYFYFKTFSLYANAVTMSSYVLLSIILYHHGMQLCIIKYYIISELITIDFQV